MKRPEQIRVENLKRIMKSEGLEALLVTKRENVRYLTGFTGSAGSVLVASGKPRLITDFRYKLQSAKEVVGAEVLIQKADFPSALGAAAERAAVKRLWFDESSLTVDVLKRLRDQGLKLKGRRDPVGELRQRKDRSELISIRKAIRRAEESFRELKRHVRPGARERSLALILEFLMREKGARKAAFDTIVASGVNGAMPHATATDRRIKKGDLITFDFGAEADGYFCDITRTICIGKPTPRQREIHALVLKAQDAAIRSIRAGMSCRAVDAVARDIIKRAGYGDHFGHGTGHGIGLMVHEGPSISPLSRDRVERDMLFTIEPGVYIPGWGGVRIEDMVLVTETGVKVMTTLPRDL